MSEYNMLYSSDIEDIKDVRDVNYKIEDNEIIFIANIEMSYDVWCHPYRIGRFNLNNGYGNIITKKGIKEYKNLKSLCKATENFNPSFSFDYNKVLESYKEYQKNNK